MGEKVRMIQVLGTSSHTGKTTVSAALCRILSRLGYSIAPFKSVNMSLNSVAIDGGYEISRSVWLQALASGTSPLKEMNPFLLKPEREGTSQLISLGRSEGIMSYQEYGKYLKRFAPDVIRNSILELSRAYDVIVGEGAGSTAEVNFNGSDFANSWVSSLFQTPSILVGDIDRGGVFASLFGTISLMENPETVRWLIINRMRGSVELLKNGIEFLESRTGRDVIGVLPHLGKIHLPGEDSLDYENAPTAGGIAVIRYPFMENQSDIDPLILRSIGYYFVDESNAESLLHASAIILPGSKDVASDLRYVERSGLGDYISRMARAGTHVLGICGGYQMLGSTIEFHDGTKMEGLGLLRSRTAYNNAKTVRKVRGTFNQGIVTSRKEVNGYMIHFGSVRNLEKDSLLGLESGPEGSVSGEGNVFGTNVHGILESNEFLSVLTGKTITGGEYTAILDSNVDELADRIQENIDMQSILDYLEK